MRPVRDRISRLADETPVVRGHGTETEIGVEKESNQFFRVG